MKVVATEKYEELNVSDSELGRIPMKGEEFEVTEDRYEILSDPTKNSFAVCFVKPLENYIQEVETAKKKEKKETTAKKTTTKKTTTKKKATK